jgi:hypothetical protein
VSIGQHHDRVELDATEHLESISPTFYKQLLRMRIPKAQSNSQVISVFFALLGSALIKVACKTLTKSTPEGKYVQSLKLIIRTAVDRFHGSDTSIIAFYCAKSFALKFSMVKA